MATYKTFVKCEKIYAALLISDVFKLSPVIALAFGLLAVDSFFTFQKAPNLKSR